jgi:hypothetical protein
VTNDKSEDESQPYEKKKKQNKTKDETPCCSKTGQE